MPFSAPFSMPRPRASNATASASMMPRARSIDSRGTRTRNAAGIAQVIPPNCPHAPFPSALRRLSSSNGAALVRARQSDFRAGSRPRSEARICRPARFALLASPATDLMNIPVVFVRFREGCSLWRPSFRRSRPIALRRQRNVMAFADLAQADVGQAEFRGLALRAPSRHSMQLRPFYFLLCIH